MGYCPYICIKCEAIQDNGWEETWEDVQEAGITIFCNDSVFDPEEIYFEADSNTRELLPNDRLWFEEGECLDDGTMLSEDNGWPLTLTVCTSCYASYLKLQQFDLQHN
jgi:hypothetical protein